MSGSEQHGREPQVHSITDASEAASIEARQRFISYSIKMALRLVLFVAGAIIAVNWNIWVGLAMLAVSAVLPWIAVMGANLVRPPESVMGDYYEKPGPSEVTAAPEAAPDGAGDVIPGTWLDPEPDDDAGNARADGEGRDADTTGHGTTDQDSRVDGAGSDDEERGEGA